MGHGIPSGKRLHFAMENHHFSWENPLFLWSCSIAMLNYQRVNMDKELTILPNLVMTFTAIAMERSTMLLIMVIAR